ncbi:hypothetical protein [Pseudalkalibacillus caeni]|nr:hypothetical protein [Pseudalkalibacillus caeni]
MWILTIFTGTEQKMYEFRTKEEAKVFAASKKGNKFISQICSA